jgi:hypothetical protein
MRRKSIKAKEMTCYTQTQVFQNIVNIILVTTVGYKLDKNIILRWISGKSTELAQDYFQQYTWVLAI